VATSDPAPSRVSPIGAWILVALWVALAIARAVVAAQAGVGIPFIVGYIGAEAIIALALAALGRWLFVARRGKGPVGGPWLFGSAAAIALVLGVLRAATELQAS
jgi:hypothetical protein